MLSNFISDNAPACWRMAVTLHVLISTHSYKLLILLVAGSIGTGVHCQDLEPPSAKTFELTSDTTVLDTNSIVPESFELQGLTEDQYEIDYAKGLLIITDQSLELPVIAEIRFQYFPFNFTKTLQP